MIETSPRKTNNKKKIAICCSNNRDELLTNTKSVLFSSNPMVALSAFFSPMMLMLGSIILIANVSFELLNGL